MIVMVLGRNHDQEGKIRQLCLKMRISRTLFLMYSWDSFSIKDRPVQQDPAFMSM